MGRYKRLTLTFVGVTCLHSQSLSATPIVHAAQHELKPAVEVGYAGVIESSKVVGDKVQTYAFGKHALTWVPPPNYSLHELTPPEAKLFMLSGPKRGGTSPVLNVSIIKAPDAAKSSVNLIIDSMLNPYRKRLSGYSETTNQQLSVNGTTYQGAYFSGSYADQFATKGFVFATQHKDAFIVFFAQDAAGSFKSTLPVFMRAIKTSKLSS